jgi:hypothetical protein
MKQWTDKEELQIGGKFQAMACIETPTISLVRPGNTQFPTWLIEGDGREMEKGFSEIKQSFSKEIWWPIFSINRLQGTRLSNGSTVKRSVVKVQAGQHQKFLWVLLLLRGEEDCMFSSCKCSLCCNPASVLSMNLTHIKSASSLTSMHTFHVCRAIVHMFRPLLWINWNLGFVLGVTS